MGAPAPALAPQRTPLRRPPGSEQGGDGRALRGRPGAHLAPQLRRGAAAGRRGRPRHPSHDPRYATLAPDLLPGGECLADVVLRMLPYWHDVIAADLVAGRTPLVAAHGNSLRALVKHLRQIPDEEIATLEIPTGVPLVFQLDDRLQPTSFGYLGEAADVEAPAPPEDEPDDPGDA